jgi:hypothetical protein
MTTETLKYKIFKIFKNVKNSQKLQQFPFDSRQSSQVSVLEQTLVFPLVFSQNKVYVKIFKICKNVKNVKIVKNFKNSQNLPQFPFDSRQSSQVTVL